MSLAGAPAWAELTPTGTPPSERVEHSAIYDPVRDRMMVFGGDDGSYRNDVWVLSLAGAPAWAELTPTGAPPSARSFHSAIYDPVRDRMVVFGGYDGSYHNDLGALSLAGTPAWTELTPTGALPSGRNGHGAIYDPIRDRMIICGGVSASYLLDVWALSLAGTPAWADATPTGTPPSWRYGHSAIYDPVRDRMLVFGGYDGSYLNDVWGLSLAGVPTWTSLTPAGTPPTARYQHAAIYDPVRDRMLVFGGYDGGERNDVWALSLAGAPAWTELTPAGAPPSGRDSHSATYDPVRDCMVVFGGYDGSYHNDVWALSLAGAIAWTELTPAGSAPIARAGHSANYDPPRDRMLAFGGFDDSDPGTRNDVWALSLAGTPAWTELTLTDPSPAARYNHSAIYDPVRDRIVVFGGYAGHYLNDAWALSLAGTPAWTELAPTGTLPIVRFLHRAIYDPKRDRIALFGGWGGFGFMLDDVWALTWGDPALASVTCPGDIAWILGASSPVSYGITNPCGFAQTADYALSSGRDWPGFPITGSVAIGAGSTMPVVLSVPVPDSAAEGLNPLTFHVTLRSATQAATCSHNLGDATTPVLLSLESALADPDRVRLTWYAADGTGLVATVYRRSAGDAWKDVGQVSPDGSGRLVYEDRRVSPGVRYGYRLGLLDQGGEIMMGETWVDVPLLPQFALAGVSPNPAARDLAVAFSLPDASPARLEVFDLAGRRILARDVGSLGGGSHVLRLGEARDLVAGIYTIRLTRGNRGLTTRAVIVQ